MGDQVVGFKVIEPVAAPFSTSGRSTALRVEAQFKMEAWLSENGVMYRFPGKPKKLAPWANIIEVDFAD